MSKQITVMIVDDSAVIRGLLKKTLEAEPSITLTESVMDGQKAIVSFTKSPDIDVILLDAEMPNMDGLTALPQLLEINPDVKIIMYSTLQSSNAETAFKAMKLGAADCVEKPQGRYNSNDRNRFFEEIRQKILALGRSKNITSQTSKTQPIIITEQPKTATATNLSDALNAAISYHVRCLGIGSSTGGPQALVEIFKNLRGFPLNVPILITQHMPATFTSILAKHLHEASGFPCVEASHNEEIKAGTVYIAPGDYHMVPAKKDNKNIITLNQDPHVNFCRPAVDPMFDALAKLYGQNFLSIILTGMGSDGYNGVKTIKENRGKVFIQDKESCVVWGMPKAISEAGAADAEVPLSSMAELIKGALR